MGNTQLWWHLMCHSSSTSTMPLRVTERLVCRNIEILITNLAGTVTYLKWIHQTCKCIKFSHTYLCIHFSLDSNDIIISHQNSPKNVTISALTLKIPAFPCTNRRLNRKNLGKHGLNAKIPQKETDKRFYSTKTVITESKISSK